jgi:hypothetical protein
MGIMGKDSNLGMGIVCNNNYDILNDKCKKNYYAIIKIKPNGRVTLDKKYTFDSIDDMIANVESESTIVVLKELKEEFKLNEKKEGEKAIDIDKLVKDQYEISRTFSKYFEDLLIKEGVIPTPIEKDDTSSEEEDTVQPPLKLLLEEQAKLSGLLNKMYSSSLSQEQLREKVLLGEK